MSIMRKLIHADGRVDMFAKALSINEITQHIGADTLTIVRLGDHVHVMLVDDLGISKGLPVNPEATKLYRATCVPGSMHQIRGAVVIVPDSDFGAFA